MNEGKIAPYFGIVEGLSKKTTPSSNVLFIPKQACVGKIETAGCKFAKTNCQTKHLRCLK